MWTRQYEYLAAAPGLHEPVRSKRGDDMHKVMMLPFFGACYSMLVADLSEWVVTEGAHDVCEHMLP